WVLRIGHVKFRPVRDPIIVGPCVTYDSHNLTPHKRFSRAPQLWHEITSDGIFSWKIAPRQTLIDDCYRRRFWRVVQLSNQSSTYRRNRECLEETGLDDRADCYRQFIRRIGVSGHGKTGP